MTEPRLARNSSSFLDTRDDDDDDVETTCTDHVLPNHKQAPTIAEAESLYVLLTRCFILIVFVAVASTTTTLVYKHSWDAEENTFESSFVELANKVTSEFIGGAHRRIAAVEGFASQLTSHVNSRHDTEWPNVVLPDFERRAKNVMMLSDVLSLTFTPIVTNETRASWEEFSVENVQWLREGLDAQGIPEDEWKYNNFTVFPEIYVAQDSQTLGVELGPGPYAPWWQFAPAFPFAPILNYDMFTHPERTLAMEATMEHKRPLVSASTDFADPSSRSPERLEVLVALLHHGQNVAHYEAGPIADLYVPIFEDFNHSKVTGELTSYVYWQVYFENLLPENDVGVNVVLENTCNQTFTYRIDGSLATYVGPGDLHEEEHSSLGVSTEFGSFLDLHGVAEDVPEGQCLYRIIVYPSDQLRSVFVSGDPLRFTMILVGSFIFTTLVFFIYDYLVERRQALVLKTAVKSSAVVASLFPEEVRDRLYQEDVKMRTQSKRSGSTSRTESTLETDDCDNEPDAIADLYPECTVQFCDIVGFTTWASSREPRDVFKLLETLYKAFDKSAFRLGVFKVETIGDCYVAATGLPNPQEDHAVIMAQFASECLIHVARVTSRLSSTLGQDTANLSIRIGIHSGPVTAGVLRGAKARFQLFGDTVNTAARMESTGARARIHLSSSTATLLRSSIGSRCVMERDEEVVAKGKGQLQTYWLKPLIEEDSTVYSFSDGTSASR